MKFTLHAPETRGALLDAGCTAFLAFLEREMLEFRIHLLEVRKELQLAFDKGDFSSLAFGHVHAEAPPMHNQAAAFRQRPRVELTSPPERNMIDRGMTSGADSYIADFDDSFSPTWENVLKGHKNLAEFVQEEPAAADTRLCYRSRGLHLEEKHSQLDGRPVAAAVFDAGLLAYHVARRRIYQGREACFYIPKIETAEEALFWDRLFSACESYLELPVNSLRVAVIIESVPAVFQVDGILSRLRHRLVAVSGGRWDYVFSHIRTFKEHRGYLLPGLEKIDPSSGMLAALSRTVAAAAHRWNVAAIGFMSAYIPPRKEGTKKDAARHARFVQEKKAEAALGYHGTWVAHPRLLGETREIFNAVHTAKAEKVVPPVTVDELLRLPGKTLSDKTLRRGVGICLSYFSHFLVGRGAIRHDDKMEDLATAEIWRCQIWQAIHSGGFSAEAWGKITRFTREAMDPPNILQDKNQEVASFLLDLWKDNIFHQTAMIELYERSF